LHKNSIIVLDRTKSLVHGQLKGRNCNLKSPLSISFTDGKRLGVYKNCLLTHLGIDDGYNSLLKKGVKEVSLYNKAKPFNNLFELHCRRSFVYLTLKFPLDNFAFVCEGFERFEGHTFIGKYLSNALIPMKGLKSNISLYKLLYS
jgi:hypothetical protein